MQDPFSWRGTLAGHKCKDAQEGCATACSVFNCRASVASDWGFSVQGNSRRGYSRKCLIKDIRYRISVCGQLQGESTAARPAKTCYQEVLDPWDGTIENVPAATDPVSAPLLTYLYTSPHITSALPWKSICEV